MPKPKQPRRQLQATALATTTPPSTLPPHHTLARITAMSGNNLYQVLYPSTTTSSSTITSTPTSTSTSTSPTPTSTLVELPSRFRSTIWLKRGSFVVVDTAALADRSNKLGGEIVNVVRDEKEWRKMSYWPNDDKEFEKKVGVSVVEGSSGSEDSGGEEEDGVGRGRGRGNDRVGRMPTPEDSE